MAKIDWYQSTIDDYPRVIADALMQLPGAHDLEHGRGRHNYHHGTTIVSADGEVLATVLHGGHNGAPNACGTGEHAPAFAEIIRQTWPDAHRVTRFDSAEDVRMPFPEAYGACQAVAADLRIKGFSVVPDDPEDGATYYIGAPTSRARIRCYEKGKQLRADGHKDADPEVIRFEFQLRPNDRQAKLKAARLSPDELWGATATARRVAGVFGLAADRVVLRQRLMSTYNKTHAAFLSQYGGHLREMLARHGSWEIVGEQIGMDLGVTAKHLGELSDRD
jgi:hypothetical protein